MKSPLPAPFLARIFFLLALIVMPASAVSITESPSHLERGDQVTVTITGLNDGSRFSLSIEGVFGTRPGTETTFQTSNFNMPISLKSGTLSAVTRGSEWTELSVQKGTTTVNLMDAADSSGVYSMSQSYSVSSGVFNYLKLRVKSRPDTSRISTQLNLAGIKAGPDDSQITFNVDGIDNGQVSVIAMVDGKQVLSKTITVGSGMAPAQTTTTPTPAATTSAGSSTTPVPTITILTQSASASGQSDTVLTRNNKTPVPTLTARIRSVDALATTPVTTAGTATTSVAATAPAGTEHPSTPAVVPTPTGSIVPQDTAAAPAPWLLPGILLALGALVVVFLVVRFRKQS